MRALFGRKISDLDELKDRTAHLVKRGQKGQLYTITREVVLGDSDFSAFAEDLLEDQSWITKEDGGTNDAGELKCIRVVNKDTGEKVLVNTEGYDYPRYTGLELK
jgi:hypothetical protein